MAKKNRNKRNINTRGPRPEYVARIQQLRRSSASGHHGHGRDPRAMRRTKAADINDQLEG